MRRRLSRAAIALLVAIASLYGAAATGLFLIQRQLIFPGTAIKVTDEPQLAAHAAEGFHVTTSAGRSEVWLEPASGELPGEQHPALIFAHGNGEVIDQWLGGLDDFRRWGMSILLVEYPGYGRSQGQPSEATIREAMVGAYDLLADRPDIDRERIVGYGQSLGGGAICTLARERHLAALILQSTFTSIRTFAKRFWMPGFLVRDPFDNDEVVRHFNGPVLVLHGKQDALIPYAEALALVELSWHGALHLYDCGHVCWGVEDAPLLDDIHEFLKLNGILKSD